MPKFIVAIGRHTESNSCYDELMNTWNERLAYALAIRGKSAADLSKGIGVRAPSISEWLNSQTREMTARNLLLVSKFLSVNPFWLILGEGQMDDTQNPIAAAKLKFITDAIIKIDTKSLLESVKSSIVAQFIAELPDEDADFFQSWLQASPERRKLAKIMLDGTPD